MDFFLCCYYHTEQKYHSLIISNTQYLIKLPQLYKKWLCTFDLLESESKQSLHIAFDFSIS